METTERRKRASREAAEWWVHLQGEMPRAQREQLVDWLRESPLHIAENWMRIPTAGSEADASMEIVSLPVRSAEGRVLHDGVVGGVRRSGPDSEVRQGADPPASIQRPARRFWPIAAAIVLMSMLGVLWLSMTRGQVIETERGERREVALPDGSLVRVDPETRLRISYQDDARRVYLEHGRALFRVAKSPTRPFWVRAADTSIRAIGTAFAVERHENEVVVTVSEGKVAVVQPPRPGAARATPKESVLAARPEILLAANQQVTVAESGDAEPVREVNSVRALAWTRGQLIFEDKPVEDVLALFNHYTRLQLAVEDPALARRPVSGVFDAADPESFVEFIQAVAPVRVVREGDGRIILAPRDQN
jgi:transmembrane sensor